MKRYYLYILPLCAIFLFNGKKYDESVIERIHLNVNICIEGQECGAAVVIAQTDTKASKAANYMPVALHAMAQKEREELDRHLKAQIAII
jgi:hypothetical protein